MPWAHDGLGMVRLLVRLAPTLAGAAAGLLCTGLVVLLTRTRSPLAALVIDEVHRHLRRAAVGGAAVLVAALALRVLAPGLGRGLRALATAATTTVIVASSTALLVLAVVLLRPAWCPTTLCSRPPALQAPEQQLGADFTAIQSATYVLRTDPAKYRLEDLPGGARQTDVAAQVAGDAADAVYRVAITLRVPDGEGLVVDQVALVVVEARPPPTPLRVATIGPPVQYRSNPYRALYAGQPKGAAVPATYVGQSKVGFVELKPGQAGELTVQVGASQPVDLKYRLRITYRAGSGTATRRLDVPYLFEVVFADQASWQRFQVRDGRLAPA